MVRKSGVFDNKNETVVRCKQCGQFVAAIKPRLENGFSVFVFCKNCKAGNDTNNY